MLVVGCCQKKGTIRLESREEEEREIQRVRWREMGGSACVRKKTLQEQEVRLLVHEEEKQEQEEMRKSGLFWVMYVALCYQQTEDL